VNADADFQQTKRNIHYGQSDTWKRPRVRPLEGRAGAEKDRFLRPAADFDNSRKRVAQESERRAVMHPKASFWN